MHRILIVDDYLDAAWALALLLRTLGHQVQIAHQGEEALRLAQQVAFSVVFLELNLSGTDGYKIASRLRIALGLRSRLIAYTTLQEEPACLQAASVDSYLLKGGMWDREDLEMLLGPPPLDAT